MTAKNYYVQRGEKEAGPIHADTVTREHNQDVGEFRLLFKLNNEVVGDYPANYGYRSEEIQPTAPTAPTRPYR